MRSPGDLVLTRRGRCLAGIAFLIALLPAAAAAGPLPRQMLLPPVELDPLDRAGPLPASLTFTEYGLPDGRAAQILRLTWWSRVAGSHAVRVGVDYVGVESAADFRYGGGRTAVGWTSRLGRIAGKPIALDLEGNLPTGDSGLFPLSAGAPTAYARLRADWIAHSGWSLWTGAWARRVAPPEADGRTVPLAWFRSGTGALLGLRRSVEHVELEVLVERALSGLPESTHAELSADFRLGEDLWLRLGARAGLGPASERTIDSGWCVGLSWRRAAPAETAPASR